MAAPDDEKPIHDDPIPGFDGLYGLELLRVDPDGVRGRVRVDARHMQPYGLMHGGIFASMAESMASVATLSGAGEGMTAAGLSNHTSFLRPVLEGDTVLAVGVPKHRGRTTWVWEVECLDSRERLCALVRVTIAVRPRRD